MDEERPQRRRRHPLYCPRAPQVPTIEVTELSEIVGNILPADLLATLRGERGAILCLLAGTPS